MSDREENGQYLAEPMGLRPLRFATSTFAQGVNVEKGSGI